MQDLQSYPPNVSDIADRGNDSFGLPITEADMWEPFTAFTSVDPSWTVTTSGLNDIQSPFLSDTPRPPLAPTKEDAENYRVLHGQVTPPSDDSLFANPPQPMHPPNLDNSHPTPLPSSIEVQPQRPVKRRRGRTRSCGGSVSGASRHSASVEPSLAGENKQEKTRARNRVAASKCRQKQKARNMELENECNFQEARKQELSREAARLRDEVVKQKNLLLAHSECGHDGIKQYLDSMVKRITTGVGEAPDFGSLVDGCSGSDVSVKATQRLADSSGSAWGFGFVGYAPTV
ncbi:hypothetical protein BJX63DRAFT_218140 [Aspergillus granulosus]|uniref:BZIP domain-containing protein n=1 Tax=Aspergillus granulosus TaxID=176169 RepID=A0ABR4I3R7_9EURO